MSGATREEEVGGVRFPIGRVPGVTAVCASRSHDDVITKDELVSAMQRLGYESGDGTLLMANHIMDTIDADQNGTIEWSEIQRALGDLESPRTPAATQADR